MEGVFFYFVSSQSGYKIYQYRRVQFNEVPCETRFNRYGYSDFIEGGCNHYRMSTVQLDQNGEEITNG